MSFSIKTFELSTLNRYKQLANIYTPATQFYKGGDASINPEPTRVREQPASPNHVMPHYSDFLSALGFTTTLTWSEVPIYFPLAGSEGFLRGKYLYQTQYIDAYLITMPNLKQKDCFGFCSPNSGFGFGLNSYVMGHSPWDPDLEKYSDDRTEVRISADDYEDVGIRLKTSAGVSTGYSSTVFRLFNYVSDPLYHGHRDWFTNAAVETLRYKPFIWSMAIKSGDSYNIGAASMSPGPAGTTVVATNNCDAMTPGMNLFYSETTYDTRKPTTAINPEEAVFTELPGGYSSYMDTQYGSFPTMLSTELRPFSGGALEAGEMRLYGGLIDNGWGDGTISAGESAPFNIDLIANTKKRFVIDKNSRSGTTLATSTIASRVNDFIRGRVAYISAAMAALEFEGVTDAPKSTRVKKQVSPKMLKKNYTSFANTESDSADSVRSATSTPTTSTGGGGGGSY